MYSDSYRPISFKLSMMIEVTELYILISVLMIVSFSQVKVV